MSEVKLALFDIEGTVWQPGGVPEIVVQGIQQLQSKGVLTTVITGTGFIRVSDILRENVAKIISPDMVVGVDNGGRVSDFRGTINLKYFPLTSDEIRQFINFMAHVDPQMVVFYPRDYHRAALWSGDEELAGYFRQRYGHFADVFTSHPDELTARAVASHPSLMIMKPRDLGRFVQPPQGLNVTRNEGSFHLNTQGVDKGTAAREIMEMYGVRPENVLVAGNYLNDLPMLTLPVGHKIFVGKPIEEVVDIKGLQFVDNVEGLGRLLLNKY